MSAWCDIATAPKDGSHFVVADFSREGFGYIHGKGVSWQAIVHWWDNPGEEGFYLSSGNQDEAVTWATHWQPLLEPPEKLDIEIAQVIDRWRANRPDLTVREVLTALETLRHELTDLLIRATIQTVEKRQ